MKFFTSILVLFVTAQAIASTPILGWKPGDLNQDQASNSVMVGVRSFVEEANSCTLEYVDGLEAVYGLVDTKNNPVIVVLSTAETYGSRCDLDKYLDCQTSFIKQNDKWTYGETVCESEETRE